MSSPLNVKILHGVGITTTDATPTIAATIPTFADHAFAVMLKVLATETDDHDEVANYVFNALFKNDGAVLSQVGATTSMAVHESNVAWDVAFSTLGQDIRITVTGAAATNISWLVDAEVYWLQSVLPNSGIIA